MHSHSCFQDEELKLHRNVGDSSGQVVAGLTFLPFPIGVRNKGLITPKNLNSTCIRTVFKIKSWNFTGTSVTLRDRSWRGWRFYRSPIGVRNKGLITQKTWIRCAFAQLNATLKLHSYVSHLPGQVVERLMFLPYPRRGHKWRVNHSKNVNATCIRSFQDTELKLHRYVNDSPGQVRGLKILPYPQRGQE